MVDIVGELVDIVGELVGTIEVAGTGVGEGVSGGTEGDCVTFSYNFWVPPLTTVQSLSLARSLHARTLVYMNAVHALELSHLTLQVSRLTCENCAEKVTGFLQSIFDLSSVNADDVSSLRDPPSSVPDTLLSNATIFSEQELADAIARASSMFDDKSAACDAHDVI